MTKNSSLFTHEGVAWWNSKGPLGRRAIDCEVNLESKNGGQNTVTRMASPKTGGSNLEHLPNIWNTTRRGCMQELHGAGPGLPAGTWWVLNRETSWTDQPLGRSATEGRSLRQRSSSSLLPQTPMKHSLLAKTWARPPLHSRSSESRGASTPTNARETREAGEEPSGWGWGHLVQKVRWHWPDEMEEAETVVKGEGPQKGGCCGATHPSGYRWRMGQDGARVGAI